jgi:PleD family two-component response regulator
VNDRSRNGVTKLDRILVIDPNPSNAKMLANLLRGINPSVQIYGAQTASNAMALAREVNPKLIFVESPSRLLKKSVARLGLT